jgi:hypothetical protein
VSVDYRELVIADFADAEAELREQMVRVNAENRILREAQREAIHALHNDHVDLVRQRRRVATLVEENRALREENRTLAAQFRAGRDDGDAQDYEPAPLQGCPA